MFLSRSGVTDNDIIVVVAMVTLTLMTSHLADAADDDRQWRGYHGDHSVVTWHDDVTMYRHNSVLQHDEPTKLEEVYSYDYEYY